MTLEDLEHHDTMVLPSYQMDDYLFIPRNEITLFAEKLPRKNSMKKIFFIPFHSHFYSYKIILKHAIISNFTKIDIRIVLIIRTLTEDNE